MRKCLIGLCVAILAVIGWAIFQTAQGVASYPDQGVNVNYPPADLYVVQDTVNCRTSFTGDKVIPDGKYVLGWWVVVKANAASVGVTVNVSPAATRVNGGGLLKSGAFIVRQGETFYSHVPIDTLTIKGVWATAAPSSLVHYQVFVEQMKWD